MRGLKKVRDFFRSDNSEFAKNKAVSRTFELIFLAFVVALLNTFLFIPMLSPVLGENPPKVLEIAVNVCITIIVSLIFVRFSWDEVNSTVRIAIDTAIDEYEKARSLDENIKRQHQEFLSTIPTSSRSGIDNKLNLAFDESLNRALRRRIARDLVIRAIAYNEDLLGFIALEASAKTLNRINLNNLEVEEDTELNLFRQDIYIYLKAWVVCSIANDNEMPVSFVKQRCDSKNELYEKAILYIKEYCIKEQDVIGELERFDPELKHVEDAISLMDEYLMKLIKLLHNRSLRTSKK